MKYKRTIYNPTISRICNKVRDTGSVETREKPGRPRIYDEREERQIVRYAVKNNSESIRDLANNSKINPRQASKSTLNNILLSSNVVSKVVPKRFDDFTQKNIKDRLKYARDHEKWDVSAWELIIFSDEVDLFPMKSGKQYVRMLPGQSLVDVVPVPEKNQRNVTVKVWGAISSSGVGPLVRYNDSMTATKYCQILDSNLLQHYPQLEGSMEIEEPFETYHFMQDGASSHTAIKTKNWMKENEVRCVEWPSKSPDLNIIENVWSYLKDQLYKMREQLTCPDDTWQKSLELWQNIPLTYIQNLYSSLPNRMKELKKVKGGPMRY